MQAHYFSWITSLTLFIAYEPSLDQAGHKAGPVSKLVNDTLVYVDRFAKDLHSALAVRNLSRIVDIVFLSDHGMTDTQDVQFIYMEDILGHELLESIEHIDGAFLSFEYARS